MGRCYWRYISERKNEVILIDYIARYFFSDELIKNGLFGHISIELYNTSSQHNNQKKIIHFLLDSFIFGQDHSKP